MLLAPDAPPEEIGRQVAQLLAIPATDFVSRDLIEVVAVGIAQFERDSASLLLTQVWQYAALDGMGIRALQHTAEFSCYEDIIPQCLFYVFFRDCTHNSLA